MQAGYNHNVKYQGRVFHVQTEDSGLQNPHVTTHLFVGGNVIESRKTTYTEKIDDPNLAALVVEIMQSQHKGLLKELIRGSLDRRIQERSAGAATLDGPAPINVETRQQGVSTGMTATLPSAPAAAPRRPSATTPSPTERSPTRPMHEPRPAMRPSSGRVDRVFNTPPPAAPAARPVAAAQTATSQSKETPAPARVIEAETLAAVFESPNEDALDSIFGEDLISEKSLDEVILSFLADDPPKR